LRKIPGAPDPIDLISKVVLLILGPVVLRFEILIGFFVFDIQFDGFDQNLNLFQKFAKSGIPLVKLVPLPKSKAKRKPGGWEGEVHISGAKEKI
jgi:hypothetical protein